MNVDTLINATNLTPGRRHREVLRPWPAANHPGTGDVQDLSEPYPVRHRPPKTPQLVHRPAPEAPTPQAPFGLLTFEPSRNGVPVRVEQAWDAALGRGGSCREYARSPEPRGLSPDHRRQLRAWGWTCDCLDALAQVGAATGGDVTVRWAFDKHPRLQAFGFTPEQVMDFLQAPKTARELVTHGLESLTRWFNPDALIEMAHYKGATRFIPRLGECVPELLRRGYCPADVLRLLGEGNGQRKLSAFARMPWQVPQDLGHEHLLNILEQFLASEVWRDEAYS